MVSILPPDTKAGDLIFCHNSDAVGWLIRAFTRSHWNHVAVVYKRAPLSPVPNDWYVVQANWNGVTKTSLLSDTVSEGDYAIVQPPPGVERSRVIGFMLAEVGRKYGYLTLLSIALDLITTRWSPCFMLPNTWICSAVAAEALRFGGWLHNWRNIYQVNPGQLFDAVYPESLGIYAVGG